MRCGHDEPPELITFHQHAPGSLTFVAADMRRVVLSCRRGGGAAPHAAELWRYTVGGGLDSLKDIEVKPDRPGHSRFKIARQEQIEGAVKILRSAIRRG